MPLLQGAVRQHRRVRRRPEADHGVRHRVPRRPGLPAQPGHRGADPVLRLCEHHALPFYGSAYVGYIAHEHIIGISKLTRLVRLFAKRFTVQERIGQQIADTLDAMLHPHGVAVYLEAHHLCTQMRGVREISPLTRTTFWRGELRERPRAAERVLHRLRARTARGAHGEGGAMDPPDASRIPLRNRTAEATFPCPGSWRRSTAPCASRRPTPGRTSSAISSPRSMESPRFRSPASRAGGPSAASMRTTGRSWDCCAPSRTP